MEAGSYHPQGTWSRWRLSGCAPCRTAKC